MNSTRVRRGYLPPFDLIKRRAANPETNGRQNGDGSTVHLSEDEFKEIVKLLLRGVDVDEDWYLTENADVAQAIRDGGFKSARHHFIEEGYFEGRKPYPFRVNEAWYLRTYPDVAESIKTGRASSPQQHFQDHGYAEGRLPWDYF